MRYLLTSLLCFFTLSLTAQETITYPYNPDSDNDAFVASTDLLELLGLYGDTFSPAEIMIGDTGLVQWVQILSQTLQAQQELINQLQSDYNALPDGIFSGDILRWNGTEWIPESPPVDECGVPNGDNSTCADDCGVLNGDNSSCTDNCGVVNGTNDCISCGDAINHEGYAYSTVQIGDQCWFSENCRYLPEVTYSNTVDSTEPYYYVYGYDGYDVTAAKTTSNYDTYGVLYNWPAVMSEGICPNGWHIPSDWEFSQLTEFLGGELDIPNGIITVAGGKMKEAGYDHWNVPNIGATNSSGFTALPGGKQSQGHFYNIGISSHLWSSSEYGSESFINYLTCYADYTYQYQTLRSNGKSARCVIDYTDDCGVPNGDNSTCLDDCGVPNGDNSTCLGCDGILLSGLVNDECGVCDGDNSTCLDECGVPNGDNSTCGCDGVPNYVVSHEGYDYTTVQIGDQCWFSENCRYLPVVSPSNEGNTTDPYYYVYDYEGSDVDAAKSTENYETYGVLYNWPAVMTEDICPSGWHIPSDGELQIMEMYLGMSESEANSTGWRGSPVGNYLKSTSGWNSNNGSNSSGFNGLPGGYRYSGGFGSYGDYGLWWSGSGSWERGLDSDSDDVDRGNDDRYHGFSARCVRD
jgi:uncharacterized protein (TIGR02145 family)